MRIRLNPGLHKKSRIEDKNVNSCSLLSAVGECGGVEQWVGGA